MKWYHSTAVKEPNLLGDGDWVWDLHNPSLWQPWFKEIPKGAIAAIDIAHRASLNSSKLATVKWSGVSIPALSDLYHLKLESTPSIMMAHAISYLEPGVLYLNGIDLSVVGVRRKQRDNILVMAGIAIANKWEVKSTNDMFEFQNYLS